jgi:hypothetical protein
MTRCCCPYRYDYYSSGRWHHEWCPGWVAYIVPPEYAGGVHVLARRVGWTLDDDGLVHEERYNEKRRKRGLTRAPHALRRTTSRSRPFTA